MKSLIDRIENQKEKAKPVSYMGVLLWVILVVVSSRILGIRATAIALAAYIVGMFGISTMFIAYYFATFTSRTGLSVSKLANYLSNKDNYTKSVSDLIEKTIADYDDQPK